MHHSVTDGIDVAHGADHGARFLRGEPRDDVLDGRAEVARGCRVALGQVALAAEGEDRLAPDALDLPARQLLVGVGGDPLGVRADELKLERRRASVEHEDVHAGMPPSRIVASFALSMLPPDTTQTVLPRTPCASAAASGAAPAPSATTRARSASSRTAAAICSTVATSAPLNRLLTSGHISVRTPLPPMPSMKLGVRMTRVG